MRVLDRIDSKNNRRNDAALKEFAAIKEKESARTKETESSMKSSKARPER
jgi:hypothetical protein